MPPHAQCLFYFTVHLMLSLSPWSVLFLFPCLLFRFHVVCSSFLRFDQFSLFLFLFPSFCCSFPCASFFCSLFLGFVPFSFFLFFFLRFVVFSSSVRLYVPFSFRLLFFHSFGIFSLSVFFFPVSLALLLPPLLFGPFAPEPASVVLLVPGLHLPCTTRNAKSWPKASPDPCPQRLLARKLGHDFALRLACGGTVPPFKNRFLKWRKFQQRLRPEDWPGLTQYMHSEARFPFWDLWVMGPTR